MFLLKILLDCNLQGVTDRKVYICLWCYGFMVNDKFGGLDFETAKMFGLRKAIALADYMNFGSNGKYGIVEDDFRCDADSGQKLNTCVLYVEGEKLK